jgi:hypothetical protein
MSKKIPDNRAKEVADRFIQLRRELGLSQGRAAERMNIGLGQIRSCLKRAYPHQHYCPLKKVLCACVIFGKRNAVACGYYDYPDGVQILYFKDLKICPK